ncbi:MAG: hypothetical protein FJX75_05310 [Armatimonadetes bacterium]|nr:hypothetical protein [Armatimonadota bacterium]
MSRLCACMVLIVLGWGLAADEPQVGAGVSLSPPQERTLGDYGGHGNHRQRTITASFSFGKNPYAISYQACIDPAHGEQVSPLEGYIGMPQPVSTGWYHGGFLFVQLNGQDIGTTPLSSMTVAESGDRAILDMVWHHAIANVRVRFLGLPNHDGLYCEIALEPKQEITSIVVQARCYPSFFTSWNHRDGARRIWTPGALVEQGQDVTVLAADNWWAVCYDEVFDVARGEGDGPCALMLLPQEAADVRFNPQSYPVDTWITYRPDQRRLHLAFWKYPGRTNADVLAEMTVDADTIRNELATTDFTPAAVKDLDIAALRAEVERATQSEAVKEYLGDRLAEVQAWLAGIQGHDPNSERPELGHVPGFPRIEAEEKLLASVGKYYGFMWEVRLAELLAGL